MRTSGVSMPEVVREIITRNRSIYDCMKMDVINFTALAVKIQADVEKTMDKPVLRISPHVYNTKDEILELVEELKKL